MSSIIDYSNSKFDKYGNLIEVAIKNTAKRIMRRTFSNNEYLTKAIIGNNITSIGYGAFFGCNSLKKYENRFFKITKSDMTCRNMKYEMNKWFDLPFGGIASLCHRGFHACTRPTDCFNYYYGDISKLRFFEVELGSVSKESPYDSKVVSDKIKFIREYSFKEFVELANNS